MSASTAPEETTESTSPLHAQYVTDIPACIARLQQGKLVAFPTETVYGLGAHAWDAQALQGIFDAKGRPTTDPLIVHVPDYATACTFWENPSELLQKLTSTFWPGPLTLVAKAQEKVPALLMAGTGQVACRSPSHSIARQLVQALPLAAPSANRFGHVSPTTPSHVMDDLAAQDVWIYQGPACTVGVESTVAQVKDDTVTILRQGAVSQEQLQACVGDALRVVTKQQAAPETSTQIAPGQLIRHYSPRIPSFLVDFTPQASDDVAQAVVIDFAKRLQVYESKCLAYCDLSVNGDTTEAAQRVFESLRWAEDVPQAQYVLFPCTPARDALGLAIQDRLTRAASGVVVRSVEELRIALDEV